MRAAKKPPLTDIRADYEIAKRGRFRRPRKGVSGVGTSADYHFRSESEWLYSIEYARDLDRNDGVAGMVVDRLLDNVLQDSGIRPDPSTGDENADAELKRRWQEWSSDEDQCDLAGEMTFCEMERSVLRGCLVDGDILPILNESGAVEVMEAHRCRTPRNTRKNVVFGVQLNEFRRRLKYLFTKEELDPGRALRKVSDTKPIDTRDEDGNRQVLHVFDPDRVSQTRGVSCFRRCADALGMHDASAHTKFFEPDETTGNVTEPSNGDEPMQAETLLRIQANMRRCKAIAKEEARRADKMAGKAVVIVELLGLTRPVNVEMN